MAGSTGEGGATAGRAAVPAAILTLGQACG